MKWFAFFLLVCIANAMLWVLWPGDAMIGVDPVIAAFAIYGVSHLEILMLRLSLFLHREANRISARASAMEAALRQR